MTEELNIPMPSNEVDSIKAGVTDIVSKAESITVASHEDAEQATLLLRSIKIQIKNAEDLRTSFTQPINQSLRAINKRFKDAVAPLLKSEDIIKGKILDYRKAEQKRIEEEQERLRAEQAKKQEETGEVEKPIVLEKQEKNVGFAQARKKLTWELEDFSKLPEKYKTVDEKKLNAAVKTGVKSIPGIKIIEEEILAVSTK